MPHWSPSLGQPQKCHMADHLFPETTQIVQSLPVTRYHMITINLYHPIIETDFSTQTISGLLRLYPSRITNVSDLTNICWTLHLHFSFRTCRQSIPFVTWWWIVLVCTYMFMNWSPKIYLLLLWLKKRKKLAYLIWILDSDFHAIWNHGYRNLSLSVL